MDELEIERGYAGFHRGLNRVLRQRDVKAFKAHVARHPMQVGEGSGRELLVVYMFILHQFSYLFFILIILLNFSHNNAINCLTLLFMFL